jgi:hypothetical protein
VTLQGTGTVFSQSATNSEQAVTTVLVAVASALATLAVVLLALVVQTRRRHAPPAPRPSTPAPSDLSALARDLHQVVVRYRETTEPARAPVPGPPVAARPPAVEEPAGTAGLEELLARTLEAARAIPGADAALVAVTPPREPLVGTLGLARDEAERLAATLPTADSRTRSIAINYEYEDDRPVDPAGGRLERGIAVPVPGVPVPALIAILTRAPAAELGKPHLGLLEEVASRLAAALGAVLEAHATATPVSITVRELDDPRGRWSGEPEEGQVGSQVDWLRRR